MPQDPRTGSGNFTEGPLTVDDPRVLGSFQLRGRLAEHTAGVIFSGRDPIGREVAVAVLHGAAASDAAVRDRLAAAASAHAGAGADAQETVLDAAPRDLVPWVAVARGPNGEFAAATALLDAAAATSGVGAEAAAGPDFAPHWTGAPEAASVAPSPTPRTDPAVPGGPSPSPADAGRARQSVAGVIAVVAAAVVLVAGAAWAALTVINGSRSDEPEPRTTYVLPDPSDSPTSGPYDPDPSPSPSRPTSDPTASPTKVPNGPPGLVAGPTYGKGERTYRMDLRGLSFDFDAPGGWGCLRTDKPPFRMRWTCIDEGGTFPPSGSGAGGVIGFSACPSPCGEAEHEKLRERIAVDATDWKKTDESTRYAEVRGTDRDGDYVVRVAMSHVYASKPGGPLDTHIAVQFTGPEAQLETMQKFVNELRARTP